MTFNLIAAAWVLIGPASFMSTIGLIKPFQGGWSGKECFLFPIMWVLTAICAGVLF